LIISSPILRSKVVDLLDALAEDFTKPEKKRGEPAEELELTDGAKTVLTDLRWLAAEGFVIEFPDTCVVIGKQLRPQEAAPAKKKVAEHKEEKALVAEEPAVEEESGAGDEEKTDA